MGRIHASEGRLCRTLDQTSVHRIYTYVVESICFQHFIHLTFHSMRYKDLCVINFSHFKQLPSYTSNLLVQRFPDCKGLLLEATSNIKVLCQHIITPLISHNSCSIRLALYVSLMSFSKMQRPTLWRLHAAESQ